MLWSTHPPHDPDALLMAVTETAREDEILMAFDEKKAESPFGLLRAWKSGLIPSTPNPAKTT